MKGSFWKAAGVAGMGALLLLSIGCARTGDTETETRQVEAGGATAARVRVDMGAGELRLRGGVGALLDATFTSNVEKWTPKVEYAVRNGEGYLTVRQPSSKGFSWFGDTEYEWDLALNNEMPTDLEIDLGAGKSELVLGGLNLTALTVETGAGETVIDLTGAWQRNLDARIESGAGEVTLRLPKDVGVQVKADTGVGKVDAEGLKKTGGAWVNDAYGQSAVTLRIDLEVGAGKINLEMGE